MTNQAQDTAMPLRAQADGGKRLRSGLLITAAGVVVTVAIYAWIARLAPTALAGLSKAAAPKGHVTLRGSSPAQC